MEQCTLPEQRAAVLVGTGAQLQPGLAGQSHLRAQPQQPPPFEGFDPPPIERIADRQGVGVQPPAAQPRTADAPVEQPASPPAEPPRVPAAVTTDTFDDLPEPFRRRIDRAVAVVDVQRAT